MSDSYCEWVIQGKLGQVFESIDIEVKVHGTRLIWMPWIALLNILNSLYYHEMTGPKVSPRISYNGLLSQTPNVQFTGGWIPSTCIPQPMVGIRCAIGTFRNIYRCRNIGTKDKHTGFESKCEVGSNECRWEGNTGKINAIIFSSSACDFCCVSKWLLMYKGLKCFNSVSKAISSCLVDLNNSKTWCAWSSEWNFCQQPPASLLTEDDSPETAQLQASHSETSP